MKIKHLIISLLFAPVFFSCNSDAPQIVYDRTNEAVAPENTEDSTSQPVTGVADLPFSFDSLTCWYFPVGQPVEAERGFELPGSSGSDYGSSSHSMGYASSNSLTNCYLDNLLIQPYNAAAPYLLTSKTLKIYSINYLYRLDTLHQKSLLLFDVIDFDSNQDGMLDRNDISSLYSATPAGKDLKRITPGQHEVLDWAVWPEQGVLFFRTIADTDKNGTFDNQDNISLYKYNLLTEDAAIQIFESKK